MALSIYCPYCHRHTALSQAVADKIYASSHESNAVWSAPDSSKWLIGICNACKKPVLVQNQGTTIFPTPLPSPVDSRIPNPMRQDLVEAKQCMSVSAYRGTAVMARRALQNACLDKGAKNTNLISQINELQQQGIITKDLKEWATAVRWIGNAAAHPNNDQVNHDDAQDILHLAEQFLHVLYVTPALFEAQKLKRNK